MEPLFLEQIAARVGGTIIGNPLIVIRGCAPIEEAGEGEITFLANPKYRDKVFRTGAAALLVKEAIAESPCAMLTVTDPYDAFSQILSYFHPPLRYPDGIDPRAVIGPHVTLGEHLYVGPCAVLEKGVRVGDYVQIGAGVFIGAGSEVGAETVIYPNVTIREGVWIGQRVILHSGSVIGSDGFGYAPSKGHYRKIPQVGGVVIEDDVEIGANVTIDRATLGKTVIGRGSKLDNLVHVGHNVTIGPDSILVAQVGISGSCRVGQHVTLAGQVGLVGHITLGDGVTVGGQSMVTKDTMEDVTGSPAIPHKKWLRQQVSLQQLFRWQARVVKLESEMEILKKDLKGQK